MSTPPWGVLLCALITVLGSLAAPSEAFAWTCDDVPASLPAAQESDRLPLSRLINCQPDKRVPMHLQAAICSADGASEVAPLPVRPGNEGELSNGDLPITLQVATAAPADQGPSHSPPNPPSDAAFADALPLVDFGYAYDIHRRPTDTNPTPAHRRGVYRPPRG